MPATAGDQIRAELGVGAGAPLIVYAGAFGAVNGVEWLADVAAELGRCAPTRGSWSSDAAPGARRCSTALARAGVLDETLFVRPPMPKREIPALLAAATVATSLFRPIPEMESNSANKFFDALAAGRPVAINYGGWHRALLTESGAGIALPEADPAAAAALLADLVGDGARLEGCREAARASGARPVRPRHPGRGVRRRAGARRRRQMSAA